MASGQLKTSDTHISGMLNGSGQKVSGVLEKGMRILDYNTLKNLPTINGIVVKGDMTSDELGLPRILIKTKEAWDEQVDYQSETNTVYVYTNYMTVDGYDIAGFKMGDGNSYLIDLPFLDTQYAEHIADESIHVTPEEKAFWNNKNRAYINGEELILTTDL